MNAFFKDFLQVVQFFYLYWLQTRRAYRMVNCLSVNNSQFHLLLFPFRLNKQHGRHSWFFILIGWFSKIFFETTSPNSTKLYRNDVLVFLHKKIFPFQLNKQHSSQSWSLIGNFQKSSLKLLARFLPNFAIFWKVWFSATISFSYQNCPNLSIITRRVLQAFLGLLL